MEHKRSAASFASGCPATVVDIAHVHAEFGSFWPVEETQAEERRKKKARLVRQPPIDGRRLVSVPFGVRT